MSLPSPPATGSVEQQTLECLESFLREMNSRRALAALRPEASLERDLGLGSLERVELLSRLERRFGVRFPETSLSQAETVRDLAELVLKGGRTDADARPMPVFWMPSRLELPTRAQSLGEVLRVRAEAEPERQHILLQGDDTPEEVITYGTLYADASAVAGGLRASGIGDGDTVALMLRTSRAGVRGKAKVKSETNG